MSLLKSLSYFRYFKNNLHFYHRYPVEMLRRALFGQQRIVTAELFFDSACNLRCWHCSSGPYLNKKIALDLPQICTILDKLKEVGTLSVCYVGGEPLLREDLPEILSQTRKRHILPTLITNGTLMTPDKARELYDAGAASFGFSLQSSKPELHDKLTNVPNSHAKLMKSLMHCIEMKYPVSVCVVPTNTNLRDGDFDTMVSFALKHGIRLNLNLPAPTGNALEKDDFLLTPENLDLLFSKYIHLDNVLPDFKLTRNGKVYCPMGKHIMYILPDGNVCPCTFTQISFGNILEESARTILDRMGGSRLLSDLKREDNCPISMDHDFIRQYKQAVGRSQVYPPKAGDIDAQ